MERKKNLHLKLEVAFDVKCDLLEDVFCCFCLKSTVLELLESFLLTFSVFVYLSGFGLKSLELTFFFIILIIVKVIVFYHLILIGKVSS